MENEFVALINDNKTLLYKVCNLYCHDAESRKDLFQEVVLQLWKSYPGFKKQASGSTWMYRVALNTAVSNFRKESRKPESKSLTRTAFEIPDIDPGDAHENKSALHLAINRLTEIEKAIILLYMDEKSYDEISDIIGISISNVGVRLNRIKTKLSTILKSQL
jgi:RNA polymerase sigma-70 factor (ECF subfamily)